MDKWQDELLWDDTTYPTTINQIYDIIGVVSGLKAKQIT